jgi:uncharacterized protein (UPF0335 family)
MTIGRNTERAKALEEQAERIILLERTHRDLKFQAKAAKEHIETAYKDADKKGFDKKTLRQVIRELLLDADSRQAVFDFEQEIDAYRHALGIEDTGESAPGTFAAKVERGSIGNAPGGLADQVFGNVVSITKESAERALSSLERLRETEAAE